jgi:UDP-N-acetylglucosamine 1-carboxyvinyltransferase
LSSPYIEVTGGRPLHGTVRVSGSKYSSLAAIPAAIIARDKVRLHNVPDTADVALYLRIMQSLGAAVERPAPGKLVIDASGVVAAPCPYREAMRFRASYYLLGAMLARFGEAEVPLPGGDEIGPRPIDQHLKGLRALGAEVTLEHGLLRAKAPPGGLHGAMVFFDVESVGATINVMLAAVCANGETEIRNAYRAPFIVDTANLLSAMGARIRGAGTNTIRIRGVPELSGANHSLIFDQTEAATLMVAGCATRGRVTVADVIPDHLEAMSAKLREAGAEVITNGDEISVAAPGRLQPIEVTTLPYPGFYTDFQQPMAALLTTAAGTSTVTETVWEERFRFVEELNRMGARITVRGRTAIIEGVDQLSGSIVRATDIRAGAALVVAGLMACGTTEIHKPYHIQRGYENLVGKLSALGATIRWCGPGSTNDLEESGQ